MGAFNFIRLSEPCPHCGAGNLSLQFKFASSYDGDKVVGRFYGHTYAVGDRMPWFEEGHREFEKIARHPNVSTTEDGVIRNKGIGRCAECKLDIEFEVLFRDRVIVSAKLIPPSAKA